MKKTQITFEDFILILVAFVWGINPVAVKVGIKYIDPMVYNIMRLLVSSILSWIILFMSGKHKKIEKCDLKRILLVSLFGYFLYQVGFIIGIDNTTAGNSSLIIGMLPISVALINKIFKIEDINYKMVIGIILSFVGVVLIILGSGKTLRISSSDIKGGLFLILAQLALGYYTIFSKPLLKKYSNIQIAAWFLSISSIIFFVGNIKMLMSFDFKSIPAVGWITNIYSGAFSMCIGNILWMWGVNKVGSIRTSLYNNLTPVFTIIVGCIFIGESFGIVKIIGSMIIFMGIYMTKKGNKGEETAKSGRIYGERSAKNTI